MSAKTYYPKTQAWFHPDEKADVFAFAESYHQHQLTAIRAEIGALNTSDKPTDRQIGYDEVIELLDKHIKP